MTVLFKNPNHSCCCFQWRVVHQVWQIEIFFFPFIEKLYPPVCSTVPASLQARGYRPRDCNKGKVEQKGRGFFYIGKNKKLIPACQSRYTFLFVSRLWKCWILSILAHFWWIRNFKNWRFILASVLRGPFEKWLKMVTWKLVKIHNTGNNIYNLSLHFPVGICIVV